MPLHKVIISGGGTGGHIFPAIAIANSIKAKYPECDILFIGANGKMEMEKVPAAGYEIVGLDILGLQRKFTLKNFSVLYKFIKSARKAKQILRDFQPDVVIGVGGYASAPTLRAASKLNIKTVIQEQNSFAGLTNKTLGKKASKICVAYDNMGQFFDEDKIVITGNPVRSNMVTIEGKRDEAINFFQLDPNKKCVLVLGGSLGARTINNSIKNSIQKFEEANIQVIWQCGKFYEDDLTEFMKQNPSPNVKLNAFIQRMDLAYAAADMIISRAGAISVSEICIVGKPAIFVPSPNVAEDHQTKNAMALVKDNAAILVTDKEAPDVLTTSVINLSKDEGRCRQLSESILKKAKPDSTEAILTVIEELVG